MGFRVLVAEDEDFIRRGIVYSLNWHKLGCGQVEEARNGMEALEKIQSGRFDLVLMDINMPMLSGLDVLERTFQEFGYVAVLITGYSDFEYAKRAIHYGSVDYLLKPVDIGELEAAVEKACAERKRRLAYAQLQEGALSRQGQIPPLVPARSREGSEVVDQIIRYIEQNYPRKITLSMLSRELFYSESFMTRRFKEEMGLNFADYLNRYRIQCALAMLRESRARLSDISAACGFSDYKYFNIVFKKYVGCSAKQFIKELSNGVRVGSGEE